MNVSYIRAVFLFIGIESVSLNAYFITYLMLSIEEKPNLSPQKCVTVSRGQRACFGPHIVKANNPVFIFT